MFEGKNTAKVNSKQYKQLKLLNVYPYSTGIYKLASTVVTHTNDTLKDILVPIEN